METKLAVGSIIKVLEPFKVKGVVHIAKGEIVTVVSLFPKKHIVTVENILEEQYVVPETIKYKLIKTGAKVKAKASAELKAAQPPQTLQSSITRAIQIAQIVTSNAMVTDDTPTLLKYNLAISMLSLAASPQLNNGQLSKIYTFTRKLLGN